MLKIYIKCAIAVLLLPTVVFAGDNHGKHGSKEHSHENHNHQDHGHGHHHHDDNTIEKIQVKASRLGRLVTESATRTEVIHGEEVQEKALMRPGNISMLVAETGGVRVQTTSPALGSANIRLQSLYGRYTQLLSDGLPLYGGQTASIGLLQIPPTDLASVEIIKGAASSLYGGSALGGVINLISRTPSEKFEGELLANFTSKDGQDLTAYFASPLTESTSGSITAGLHHQAKQDLDDDGWIDMAGYNRATVRPRLYWQGEGDANLYLTLGAMSEQRDGGTLENAVMPDGSPFVKTQDSQRIDMGIIFDMPIAETMNVNLKGSAMQQEHSHQYGNVLEDDDHESYLIESNLSGNLGQTAWLVGLAFQSQKLNSLTFPEFNYSYQVPGLFSQVEYEANDNFLVSLSARVDWHSEFGTQTSPRVSMLYRPGNWSIRGSYGQGYFAPSPFIEDIEAAGLSRLAPLENVKAEQASTASIDLSYALGGAEASMTLFASDVTDAAELELIEATNIGSNHQVRVVNADGETQIRGAEMLLRYRWQDFKFTGSYLYTDATKQDEVGLGRVPLTLTPRHSAGIVIMWEEHGSNLLGFEAYYSGTQELENNPYRQRSEPYWHLGLLGQITFGRVSWFLNAENLLNVRQTKEDPLVLPIQAASGRWTTDIWSRNDGFTVNAGVRFQF